MSINERTHELVDQLTDEQAVAFLAYLEASLSEGRTAAAIDLSTSG